MDFNNYPQMRIFIIYTIQTTRPNAVTRAPGGRLNESISLQQDALFDETARPIKLRLLREK